MGAGIAAAISLIGLLFAGPVHLAAADDQSEIEEVLRATDDMTRGSSSMAVIEMQVKTAQYERTMRMQAWSQGTEKTLLRILYPEKDAGISTLKVDDNLWNYLPKVDRTIKVPAGMMSGSWMGSHMTNDDLVKDSRLSDDFIATLRERPKGGVGRWVIDLVPREGAAVVWGRIEAFIGADKLPQEMRYYDEKGVLVRTMTWSDVQVFDNRRIPGSFSVVPADKPGEFTRVTYMALDFDAAVDPNLFTLQALRP